MSEGCGYIPCHQNAWNRDEQSHRNTGWVCHWPNLRCHAMTEASPSETVWQMAGYLLPASHQSNDCNSQHLSHWWMRSSRQATAVAKRSKTDSEIPACTRRWIKSIILSKSKHHDRDCKLRQIKIFNIIVSCLLKSESAKCIITTVCHYSFHTVIKWCNAKM